MAHLTTNNWTIRLGALAVMIALMAVFMTFTVQADGPDWRLPVTGLTAVAGDDPGEMLITWDAHTQTTKTLLNYRVAWTPQGESFKKADQTDWNTHTTGTQHTVTGLDAGETYQVKIRTKYEGRQGSRWTDVATGQAGQAAAPTNSAATGQPTITGTAEVGQILTAGNSGIADGNGTTNAVFTFQWVRSASGSDNDITNATGSTYVITNADIDTAIKVRVNFSDDDGYSETLTSNATASVPVPAPVIVPPEAPQIAEAAGDTEVPDDWNLIPTGKGLGDRFRLIFLSSTKRNATSSSISTYNTWIQTRAADGHMALDDYSDQFKAVGCTNAVDARDNTGTTGTGVPIYWLNGNKVADNYADFYDETWGRRSQQQERVRHQWARHFRLGQLPRHRMRPRRHQGQLTRPGQLRRPRPRRQTQQLRLRQRPLSQQRQQRKYRRQPLPLHVRAIPRLHRRGVLRRREAERSRHRGRDQRRKHQPQSGLHCQ